MSLERAIHNVTDFDSLTNFFSEELGWDIDPSLAVDDVTFEWDAEDLSLSESAARRLGGGAVRQLQPFPDANQPWAMKPEEFTRRARHAPVKLFNDARDETAALTEELLRVEREIDERVAALYGVPLPGGEAGSR